ncbi:hypothetical protein HX850_04765 [Marine Group I thaumarchaeote]|jgi:hypothetical protein|uniref:Uncharacterized protein n=1 Tax=Marine Group I thaumarchaeote TaxID=2511932 RepID=A0A7K4MLW9_9ARCH|nr:hypothetical protein [Marine Group I thaumarchaeote]|tara:strand:+ start:1210 stop:1446 length:237 start_codon:yes stop_codon:yes gene_type:complete
MSLGGNLIFFGTAILILDVLIFSGTFPSKSLNDPSLHEPFLLLPVIGIVSFIELLSLFLTSFGLIIFFSGVITLRKKK